MTTIQAYRERINFLRRVHRKRSNTPTAEKAKLTIADLEQRMSELKEERFIPTDLERRILLANVVAREHDFDAANLRDCLERDEPIYITAAVRGLIILSFELALAPPCSLSEVQQGTLRERLSSIIESNEEQDAPAV